MNAEPLWWTSRKGDTVSRQFAALQAARTPEVQPVRPLAPVIALNAVRLAKDLNGIRIPLREEA